MTLPSEPAAAGALPATPAPAAKPLPVRPGRWTAAGLAKVGAIALVAAPLIPVQWAVLKLGLRRHDVLPKLFHRIVCRILGVRTQVVGRPPGPGEGGLIVANHVSWLDIPVVTAQTPTAFVAKSEIAGWPVIGLLAKLQRTLFVDRSRRSATAAVASNMGRRLSNGDRIVLFGEGTTSDGSRILPFRSSLFGAVREALGQELGQEQDSDVVIRPLAILYMGRHGIPGGRVGRAALAWYGDTALGPHLRDVLTGGPIDVRLVWGEPIRVGRGHSRKEAARLAETTVRRAAIEHFNGRPLD